MKHFIWTVLFQLTKTKAGTPCPSQSHYTCHVSVMKILFTHAKYMGHLIYKCPDEYRSTFRDAETNREADNEGSVAKYTRPSPDPGGMGRD